MPAIDVKYKRHEDSFQGFPQSPSVFFYSVKNTSDKPVTIINKGAHLLHTGSAPTTAIGLYNVQFIDTPDSPGVTFSEDDTFHNKPILAPDKTYTAVAGVLDARTPSTGPDGNPIAPPALNWSEWTVEIQLQYEDSQNTPKWVGSADHKH